MTPQFGLFSHLRIEFLLQSYRVVKNKGLKLLNPGGVLTHNRGKTIDLAFCLENCSKCEIRPDLHTASGYETLVATICWNFCVR